MESVLEGGAGVKILGAESRGDEEEVSGMMFEA